MDVLELLGRGGNKVKVGMEKGAEDSLCPVISTWFKGGESKAANNWLKHWEE